jgi:hypothetical protein
LNRGDPSSVRATGREYSVRWNGTKKRSAGVKEEHIDDW